MASYLVTGASRGLGFEFLRQLSENQANTVIGLVRDLQSTKNKVFKELKRDNIHILQADLNNYETNKNAVADVSKITGRSLDCLIANAAFISTWSAFDGIGVLGNDPRRLDEDLLGSFKTNVVGNVHLFNLSMPLVQQGTLKKIVSVSSGMSDPDFISKSGIEVAAPYSIGKAAMNTAVAKFSAQHAQDGILFFSISPGVIDTGLYDDATEEEKQRGMAILVKMAKYVPHFTGPSTAESSVKSMLSVIEKASVEGGYSGSFVSHHGNKEWL